VNWINDHVGIARAQGKPLVLGEYGLEHSSRSSYKDWLDAVASSGAAGALVWELLPVSRATAVPGDPFNLVYPTDVTDVANQKAAAAIMNAK
jgi:endo-1,4-beta-mannosidase